jgi:hypothetical protein
MLCVAKGIRTGICLKQIIQNVFCDHKQTKVDEFDDVDRTIGFLSRQIGQMIDSVGRAFSHLSVQS